jgi:hypothetical protein
MMEVPISSGTGGVGSKTTCPSVSVLNQESPGSEAPFNLLDLQMLFNMIQFS